MIRISLSIFALFICSQIQAQYISSVTEPDTSIPVVSDTNNIAVKLANTVTAADISKHLHILASDEFEGRETGQKGNRMAAQYIADHFKTIGLPAIGDNDSYFQNVAFTTVKWENTEMFVKGKRLKHLWDYLAFPTTNNDIPFIGATEITFLGFGIQDDNYDDYDGVDVDGKVIMIYNGEPMNQDSVSYITGTKELSEWTTDIDRKMVLAKSKGARLVIVIENYMKDMLKENRRKLVGASMQLGNRISENPEGTNYIFISPQTASKLWGDSEKEVLKARDQIRQTGKPKSIDFEQQFAIRMDKSMKVLEAENVMGYVEGTDKKDEIVVVSAHYDHLGKRNDAIYNGADDNGSGTSTLLDLAEAFQTAKEMGAGPRRSVLFLLVTGEEKGLLGSEYYAERPVFPMANTVVDVNVDMIGRVDEKHKDNPNYIYVIGSDRLSSQLHKINETANQKYTQITLDYTYNDEADSNRFYYRSDHYNFARKGVPAIFYFSGVHEDYHRTTDTVDKIMFEKVEKIGRLIFHTTWELANREDRIEVDGIIK